MAVSRPNLESYDGFLFLLHLPPIGERILSYSYSLETVFALQSICAKFRSTFQGLTQLQAKIDRHCSAVMLASGKLAKKHEVGPTCHLCRSTETHAKHYSLHLGTKEHTDDKEDKECEKCYITLHIQFRAFQDSQQAHLRGLQERMLAARRDRPS